MSWWSDGEPFDEHDPEWCYGCKRTDVSKAICDKCCAWHEEIDEQMANECKEHEQFMNQFEF